MLLPCPTCGADVTFKSRSTLFQVCSFCTSMLVRTDVNLATIGKMAELPPDSSLIQVGTRGRFEQKNFEVIGKKRLIWEHGAWNEWFLYMDDGREAWLAEAQGMTMISFPVEDASVPALSLISVGASFMFGSQQFIVEDIKTATSVGGVGELPSQTFKGQKSTYVDLNGANGTFASIDYSNETPRLYTGKYIEFETCDFQNLRTIDGWE